MKGLNIVRGILGIVLTVMGAVALITAITTSAGLDAIVVGGLFTFSGIVAIISTIIDGKSMKK